MAANVRHVINVTVSDNIINFLTLMGYQYHVLPPPPQKKVQSLTECSLINHTCVVISLASHQHEFIREGISVQNQRKISVTITQIKKVFLLLFLIDSLLKRLEAVLIVNTCNIEQVVDKHDFSSAEVLDPATWLVELFSITDGSLQSAN